MKISPELDKMKDTNNKLEKLFKAKGTTKVKTNKKELIARGDRCDDMMSKLFKEYLA